MEGSVKELSVYRMERAKEMLKAAEDNLRFIKAFWSNCLFHNDISENKKDR